MIAEQNEGDSSLNYDSLDFEISDAEVSLRQEVEKEDRLQLTDDKSNYRIVNNLTAVLSSPMDGLISAGYDASISHFGVDVVGKTNEEIKAVLSGTVVFADWTSETGNVILGDDKPRF